MGDMANTSRQVLVENQLNGADEDKHTCMNFLNVLDGSKRVLVVGDIVLDKYIYGTCTRIAQEFPMPIFSESSEEFRLGGAANVANNLRAMGLVVDLLTVVGDEVYTIKQLCSKKGLGIKGLVECPNYQVKTNTRYFANGRQCFRADKNSQTEVPREIKRVLAEKAESFLAAVDYDVVIISDYRNGMFDAELAQDIISTANKYKVATIVDPKRGNYERFKGATCIKPNEEDARYFSQSYNSDNVHDISQTFCEKLEISVCIMTLAERGLSLYDHRGRFFKMIPAQNKNVEVVDVCGCGDTVAAALAFGIAHRQPLADTCHLANMCAANVIQRQGTVEVNMADVITDKVLRSGNEVRNLKRVLPKDKVVILTTGCFDLLHIGHVTFLGNAKELGDYLIVALNSDVSVKKNKGDTRPVCTLRERCAVLETTKYVDFIVVFDEKRPEWVVEVLDPDILVKGEEYSEERIRKDYPSLRTYMPLPSAKGCSTTAIIKRIREQH